MNNQSWHKNAIDSIEESIKQDFKNIPLLDLLSLQNIFYYQFQGQNAEYDYIYQLLAEEIEKRLR